MPVETIGEFGTPGASSEWLDAQAKLAIRHVKQVCGDPPPEMELEIVWKDHELGNYPVIGLVWEDPTRGAPWNYISRCEMALTAYENDGELPPGWSMPPASADDEDKFDEDYLNSETPPEPPANIDFFEIQRYTSKLTEWALKASAGRRHMPKLVEKDEDDGDQENEKAEEPTISTADPRRLSRHCASFEELDQQAAAAAMTESPDWTPYQRYLHRFIGTLMSYARHRIRRSIN